MEELYAAYDANQMFFELRANLGRAGSAVGIYRRPRKERKASRKCGFSAQ